jgi:hypothetical protein
MIRLLTLAAWLPGCLMAASGFDQPLADRFFRLALDCVHKEYPNKISARTAGKWNCFSRR